MQNKSIYFCSYMNWEVNMEAFKYKTKRKTTLLDAAGTFADRGLESTFKIKFLFISFMKNCGFECIRES